MKTIKLSSCEVDIKDDLTWGDVESLKIVLMKGAKIGSTGLTDFDLSSTLDAKYALLETAVLEIRQGDKKLKYTKDWMNGLSIDDGDLLYLEVDKLNKKKVIPTTI